MILDSGYYPMTCHHLIGGERLSGGAPPCKHQIESSFKLKLILEEPMQTGETLFSAASYNSLPIASDLIARNIEINFINDLFMTPQARTNQNLFWPRPIK